VSVLLRPLEVADAAELLALLVANRTFLQPFEPVRADRFFTLDEQRALLRTMADDRADDRGYAFAVVERGEGVIVGQVTLSTVVRGAKYAHASKVIVRLDGSDARLEFSVTDDGRGFDAARMPPGSGLQNMEDRLAALGGSLTVVSSPGRGTVVSASVAAMMPSPNGSG